MMAKKCVNSRAKGQQQGFAANFLNMVGAKFSLTARGFGCG
jgi:hypothetical protein